MSYIWVDELRSVFVTEQQFLEQINKCEVIPKYIRAENPYEMILQLVVGMVCGKEMFLLDSDFSLNEIAALGIEKTELNTEFVVNVKRNLHTIQNIKEQICKQPWKLWLFTSGTTGLPKKVCHTYATLSRNVRISERYSKHIWAFAYRFSHMAGLQVMFQALMNANPMIYVFECAPNVVVKFLMDYHCTHISATPTFYRNILPFMNEYLIDLTDVTMGGEKYDTELCKKISGVLPHVKLHNVYAATETGSILNAKGDQFIIPEKYKDKVKISENHELLIHRSLLGQFPIEGEWYNTHDLVDEQDGKLHFLSRQSDLINVGGYKVNPLEVEEAILMVPGVVDCLIKGKPNSVLGNILAAEIIKADEFEEQNLKQAILTELKAKMQPFKIPRMFKFVVKIERTRSGKKVRK